MVYIPVYQGLDIPIEGEPEGAVREAREPSTLALDLKPFPDTAFSLLVKIGDHVRIGTPLVADKQCPSRVFVSPAGGVVQDIVRGDKRKLHHIIIQKEHEEQVVFDPLDPKHTASEALTTRLLEAGLFPYIHCRPFARLAHPNRPPRSIFVKAVESAPFVPSAEMQIAGQETFFATGLQALQKLTTGPVHLVYREGSTCKAFSESSPETSRVQRHTVSGPHPASNPSLHIQKIDPINSPEDVVWVVSALDVVRIGHLLQTGRFYTHRIVGSAGPACAETHRGFYRVRDGMPLSTLFEGAVLLGEKQWISGDPLMGDARSPDDYLGFYHTAACLFPEQETRPMLHFFRLGKNRYTASRTYLSGHSRNPNKRYPFTTGVHGEPRALITNLPYEKVMPLRIPTLPLVRAVMAEDYEQAEQMGLLEVAGEDFALPTFVCPSKVEMVEIIEKGLRDYAAQVLPQG